jgi:hypothetical protein
LDVLDKRNIYFYAENRIQERITRRMVSIPTELSARRTVTITFNVLPNRNVGLHSLGLSSPINSSNIVSDVFSAVSCWLPRNYDLV